MTLAAVIIVLAGLVAAPIWGAPPAEACENCSFRGEGTGQVGQIMQALTGVGGPPQTVGPVVTSTGEMTTVGTLAQAVTRRLGAGHLLGVIMPVYWR
jgi:hypothetical protein